MSDGEVEEVVDSEGKKLSLQPASKQRVPGHLGAKSGHILYIWNRWTDDNSPPPPQLTQGTAISPRPEFSLLLFSPKDFLHQLWRVFYLFVIFSKKWLQQCSVKLMCPKKQTCSLVLFSFIAFEIQHSSFRCWPRITGQCWFLASGLCIWDWLKKNKAG